MKQANPQSPAVAILCALLGMVTAASVANGQTLRSEAAGAPSWKTAPAGGETLRAVDDAALKRWWTVFNDPELTSLEERALKSNLDLRTALSSIEQARANRMTATAGHIPSLAVTGTSSGNRSSTWSGGQYTVGSQTTTLAGGQYTSTNSAEFVASWEPDFFGSVRKNIASYDASIEAAQEGLRNTMVTLTATLATDYIALRSAQAQIAVTQSNLAKYRETYEMTLAKRESGLAADLDVTQARETVEATEATLPGLEETVEQNKNAIALLLAQRPGAVDAELAETKPIPAIPAEVAVGIPGDLLRRRPDVKQAERQVVAQALQLGVAKANLYPTFTLSGTFLFSAANLLDVFAPAALGSTVAGAVQQTLLNRRTLRAQVKLQSAVLDQDEIAYQNTLLGAVRDVENSLYSFGKDQTQRTSLEAAAGSAEQAAEMSRELYASGWKDFLTVLDAERTELTAQNNLVQSQATVDTDLIALYKAMGGGWN